VYGIVKQSGGNVWVYSEPGRGTTFKVYVPVVDAPAQALASEHPQPAITRGNETILLVEDDELVRNLAKDVLAGCGYSVLVADGPGSVMTICEKHTGQIDLVLTDVVMPGFSGREVAREVLARRPAAKVLYMSGYTTNAIVHHGELEPGTFFLPKPFTPNSLAVKVREVLDEGHGKIEFSGRS
jgi:two-component system cell cycle sensor histidine kinase/response regulator CckA